MTDCAAYNHMELNATKAGCPHCSAVPAQEAPREQCLACLAEQCHWKDGRCEKHEAEPQAGAQDELLDEGGLSVNDLGLMLAKERTEFVALQTHLNTIKSYVIEAAKTPITRETLLDERLGEEALRMLALTQYDELQGFCRLVLSEIGDGL